MNPFVKNTSDKRNLPQQQPQIDLKDVIPVHPLDTRFDKRKQADLNVIWEDDIDWKNFYGIVAPNGFHENQKNPKKFPKLQDKKNP